MFDIIGGTSTGGILASLIGIRGYSLEKCRKLYKDLATIVFTKGSKPEPDASGWSKLVNLAFLLKNGAYYKAKPLEDVLWEYCGSEPMIDTTMNPKVRRIKVFFTSTLVSVVPPLTHVWRNYSYPQDRLSRYIGNCTARVCHALRASTSAPSYFEDYIPSRYPTERHQDGTFYTNL